MGPDPWLRPGAQIDLVFISFFVWIRDPFEQWVAVIKARRQSRPLESAELNCVARSEGDDVEAAQPVVAWGQGSWLSQRFASAAAAVSSVQREAWRRGSRAQQHMYSTGEELFFSAAKLVFGFTVLQAYIAQTVETVDYLSVVCHYSLE